MNREVCPVHAVFSLSAVYHQEGFVNPIPAGHTRTDLSANARCYISVAPTDKNRNIEAKRGKKKRKAKAHSSL